METSNKQPPAGRARNSGGDVQGKGVTLNTEESRGGEEPANEAEQQPTDSATTTED